MKLQNVLFAIGLFLAGGAGYFFANMYSNLATVILMGGFLCWIVYMIYDIHQIADNTGEMIRHLPEAKSLIQRAIHQGAVTPPGFFKRSKIDFEKLD